MIRKCLLANGSYIDRGGEEIPLSTKIRYPNSLPRSHVRMFVPTFQRSVGYLGDGDGRLGNDAMTIADYVAYRIFAHEVARRSTVVCAAQFRAISHRL